MTKLIAEWSVAGTLINEDPRRDCSNTDGDDFKGRKRLNNSPVLI